MWIAQRGVLSFSKTSTDALLWAHYADGHRGLCLGFDFEKMGVADKPDAGSVEYIPAAPLYRIVLGLPRTRKTR